MTTAAFVRHLYYTGTVARPTKARAEGDVSATTSYTLTPGVLTKLDRLKGGPQALPAGVTEEASYKGFYEAGIDIQFQDIFIVTDGPTQVGECFRVEYVYPVHGHHLEVWLSLAEDAKRGLGLAGFDFGFDGGFG